MLNKLSLSGSFNLEPQNPRTIPQKHFGMKMALYLGSPSAHSCLIIVIIIIIIIVIIIIIIIIKAFLQRKILSGETILCALYTRTLKHRHPHTGVYVPMCIFSTPYAHTYALILQKCSKLIKD